MTEIPVNVILLNDGHVPFNHMTGTPPPPKKKKLGQLSLMLSSAPSRAFEMMMLGLVTQDDLDTNPGLDFDQNH